MTPFDNVLNYRYQKQNQATAHRCANFSLLCM
ncbi:unnamed protein product [Schistosoma mattheei]|uniref:Uncharacterized protein n=1 Tax=Schistosoma mattheei TaxID=31246 RepID=A0A183PZX6_9TREM|nr:unnamed protein product [Schistosoma mattheei]